jgi:hypothetical protein
VALHVWGVRSVPRALWLMATGRRALDRVPGLTFGKLLGTGSGRSFTMRDADPGHWAALTCWSDLAGPGRFERSTTYRRWSALSDEQGRMLLRPLRSRGRWSGRTPFGDPSRTDHGAAGPVAALTRARIRPSQWPRFWRSVPPVSLDAHAGGGLLFGMGIGEAPVGLQGTFSIWRDEPALLDFAYRRGPHRDAIRRTEQTGWYAEELFARFAVTELSGRYRGHELAALLPPPAGAAS